DDYAIVDDEVDAILTEQPTLVARRERHFTFVAQPSIVKFDRESGSIERLEESATENAVNLNCASDYSFGEPIDLFQLCVSVSLWLIHLRVLRYLRVVISTNRLNA